MSTTTDCGAEGDRTSLLAARRLSGLLRRRKPGPPEPPERLEKQLKDYVGGGLALYWKRQGMYVGAGLICGFYYSVWVAVACFCLCQIAEFLDARVSRKVMAWPGGDPVKALRYRRQLFATAALSASAVALFVYLIAWLEGTDSHFTPLFFLFAAGLFAAINNHQLPQILTLRLVIYGVVFLFIPIRDLWVIRPPMESILWLHFLTAAYVLYFVLECSFIFLQLYRRGLDQLDELRLQRDRAQEAFEVKSQFVSVVSHELRTPLTSISGALSLLRSGAFNDDPARAAEILGIAHKNSLRLSALINDLLDLQKLEHGKMRYTMVDTDLGRVIREAVESISTFNAANGTRVEFAEGDRPVMAPVDHDRLLQVLDNLLSNAVKFSRPGGVVRIRLEERETSARISVIDQGIGIPDNAREKVFGRFSQVDSSDRRTYGGTGLGLSIAHEIVLSHGGTIDYTSKLGEGTTFVVDLPRSRSAATAAAAAA